jgi:hypothetical protein
MSQALLFLTGRHHQSSRRRACSQAKGRLGPSSIDLFRGTGSITIYPTPINNERSTDE